MCVCMVFACMHAPVIGPAPYKPLLGLWVRVAQRGRRPWLAVIGPPRFCGWVGMLGRTATVAMLFCEVRRRAFAAAPIRLTRTEGPKSPWQVNSGPSPACHGARLASVPWRRPGLRSATSSVRPWGPGVTVREAALLRMTSSTLWTFQGQVERENALCAFLAQVSSSSYSG